MIDYDTIVRMSLEIAAGMEYLHAQRIIHRDLKSLNVLLDDNFTIKICDFGLSKTMDSIKSSTSSQTVGSAPWSAPEFLDPKKIKERSEKGDVFSFGVVLWELLARKVPWKEEGYMLTDIIVSVSMHGSRLNIPECDPLLKQIMEGCWLEGNWESASCFNARTDNAAKLFRYHCHIKCQIKIF